MPSANSFSVHSIVVLERGAALPASWLHPGSDVIVLSELESENSDDFAQRVVRAVAGLAKSAMIAEVRLFTAQDRTEDRLRARSQIARALLAAMSRAPAARITFVANQDAAPKGIPPRRGSRSASFGHAQLPRPGIEIA